MGCSLYSCGVFSILFHPPLLLSHTYSHFVPFTFNIPVLALPKANSITPAEPFARCCEITHDEDVLKETVKLGEIETTTVKIL